MSWTDDRVELLKKMWGEGQSASQIAKELGGVTRNAVIGKVHRLGLSNRSGGGTKAAPKEKPARKAAPKAKAKQLRDRFRAALRSVWPPERGRGGPKGPNELIEEHRDASRKEFLELKSRAQNLIKNGR